MHIKDKILLEYDGLIEHGPITIVAFGDSVTHGAVATGEMNYETVYWNRLRKRILAVRDYVPVNVINAGIGGITAKGSLGRLESQALKHAPDLIIVCFGLNDVNGSLEDFVSSLRVIFEKCKASGADVIYLSPNMLNTYVAEDTSEIYLEYAAKTAEIQNSGRMDLYIESAIAAAKEMGVAVCDCYGEWKKLSETRDTTMLLANRINHPTKDMHELFASKLFDMIFEGAAEIEGKNNNTMYSEE